MPDDVLGISHLTKAFAPRREPDVAISDGPAERLGENARIVLQVGRSRSGEIVDLSDLRHGIVEDYCDCSRHVVQRPARSCRRPRAVSTRRRLARPNTGIVRRSDRQSKKCEKRNQVIDLRRRSTAVNAMSLTPEWRSLSFNHFAASSRAGAVPSGLQAAARARARPPREGEV